MSILSPITRRLAGAPRRAGSAPPADSAARLVCKADAVLSLATRLRATASVSSLARLREQIVVMLLDFRAALGAVGIDPSRIGQATEVLSALIDHVVTSMPWGSDGGWKPVARSTGATGSRSPAQHLLDVARASSSDAGLGELISVAVALGFDKRSRGQDDPYLEQLLALLAAPGQNQGLHAEQGLCPDGRSFVERRTVASWLPLWVTSLVTAAVLAVLFFGLEVSLGTKSDQVYARMAALNGPQTTRTSERQPAATPRLGGSLAQYVAARDMDVRDEIDRSVVIVPGAKLFQAGTAALLPASAELLRPVAVALQRTPGRIQVIGHTDGAIARSARYPSDWEFSVDRARAVQEALRSFGIEASRLTYDGRANVEPLPANDRMRLAGGDGRIAIVLLAGR